MKLFIADIKYIARFPALLFALLSPVFIALFLLYGFPIVSGLTKSGYAFFYDRYYAIIAITLISAIPLLYGLLISFVHLAESVNSGNHNELAGNDVKRQIKLRMAFSISLSFCVILPLIYLTDAVPTEGWLRSIYAAFLLSVMTALIFLFSICSARGVKLQKTVFFVSALFLMTVPSGLLLHHPWNYFIFFSPFYWISWAWIIPSPAESLMYGIISLVIAGSGMLILYRYFTRNSKTD
jgi:hypothetical protein